MGFFGRKVKHWQCKSIDEMLRRHAQWVNGAGRWPKINWHQLLDGDELRGYDFSGKILYKMEIRDVEFVECKFDGADMREMKTHGCDFIGCTFKGARTDGWDRSFSGVR